MNNLPIRNNFSFVKTFHFDMPDPPGPTYFLSPNICRITINTENSAFSAISTNHSDNAITTSICRNTDIAA